MTLSLEGLPAVILVRRFYGGLKGLPAVFVAELLRWKYLKLRARKDMMDNKAFAKQLEKRTRKFAVKIIHLSSKLPNAPEAIVIRNQITKSGTSIGANYLPC